MERCERGAVALAIGVKSFEEGERHDFRYEDFVTYHVQNMRYDLVGGDLAILLEEFASFERDTGHILGVPSLMPTIWLMKRAVSHDKRPQQLFGTSEF